METYIRSDRSTIFPQPLDRLAEVRKTLAYEQEGLKVDISEEIWNAMQARGLSQADLARKIGKSRAYVTKVLKGTTNFTFDTTAAILWALDHLLEVNVVSREEATLRDQISFQNLVSKEGFEKEKYDNPLKIATAVKEASVGGDHDQDLAA